jgi:hypothetical protein
MMRLPVKKHLTNQMTFGVGCLDFLCSNILTLLKLKDVFLPINNFHCIVTGHQHSNISSFQPPILSDCLFCLLFVFIVAHKYLGSSKPYLSSWGRPSFLISIHACVMHFFNICKLKL